MVEIAKMQTISEMLIFLEWHQHRIVTIFGPLLMEEEVLDLSDTLTVTISSGWGNSIRDGLIAGVTILIGVLTQEYFSRRRVRNETIRSITNEVMKFVATLISESKKIDATGDPKGLLFGTPWWEAQFELRSRLRLMEASVKHPFSERLKSIKSLSQELIARIGVLENELGRKDKQWEDSTIVIIDKANALYTAVFGDGKIIRAIAAEILISKKLDQYKTKL